MLEAEHNYRAPGFTWRGVENWVLDGVEYTTWSAFAAEVRRRGETAVRIRPCENADRNFYFGSGGYRYRDNYEINIPAAPRGEAEPTKGEKR